MADAVVIDSSVAISWGLSDVHSEKAKLIFDDVVSAHAFVPSLWLFEVANVCARSEKKGKLTRANKRQYLASLSLLPIVVETPPDFERTAAIAELAVSQNLTAYNAAYLELAMRRGLKLATFDDSLKSAAKAVGVSTFDMR